MWWRLTLAGLIVVIAATVVVISSQSASRSAPGIRGGPGLSAGSAPDRLVRRRFDLGRSVRGRRIVGVQLGDPDAQRSLLVVGCIHGNEPAGIAIARRLERSPPPPEQQIWAIANLNPDGVLLGTRQNADGVDLNRNFPWRWGHLGPPGTQQYSGPRPLSEPEARIARSLILRVRPRISVWFHQPLGLVDQSGGRIAPERRFAHLIGLPLRRLTRYPGSATGWTNHSLTGGSAFVVELPRGRLAPRAVERDVQALIRLGANRRAAA
jgi:murein peptide amidase A